MRVLGAVPLLFLLAVGAPGQLEDERLGVSGAVMYMGTREPVPGVSVRLWKDGAEVATVRADARGRFTFSGLAPGRYRLIPDGEAGQRLRDVDVGGDLVSQDVEVWLRSSSRISGRVTDADGHPIARAAVRLETVRWVVGSNRLLVDATTRTDEDGQFEFHATPGRRYYLEFDEYGESWGTPLWYPGVSDPSNAVPLEVRAGIDIPAVNMTVQEADETHRVRISLPGARDVYGLLSPGASVIPDGAHILGGIRLFGTVDRSYDWFTFGELGEDVWESPDLPPGDYEVLLRYAPAVWRRLAEAPDLELSYRHALDPIARVRVEIEDRDLDLGAIAPDPRANASGRAVVRPSGEPPHAFDFSLTYLDLIGEAYRTFTATRGSFLVEGLAPGLWRFEAIGMPPDWYVASVTSGGRDVLREGLEGGVRVDPIVIVVAADSARIQGVVRDEDSRLVPDAVVVLIPPAGKRGPVLSFPSAAADEGGAFSLERVPPGAYRLVALDVAGRPLLAAYPEDPRFVRSYEPRGRLITVDPGARMTIDAEAIPIDE